MGLNPTPVSNKFFYMEGKKGMNVLVYPNIRKMVNAVNDLGIQKEDIVSIEKVDNDFILIYYE